MVIALAVDTSLALLPEPGSLAARIPVMLFAVVLNALATALYIGAGLGPGPRDGLMTGLVGRSGRSVRLVRTGIEVTVLATGWMLGGTVGVGTVVYALGIGPLIQLMMRAMQADRRGGPGAGPVTCAPADVGDTQPGPAASVRSA
ncbi:hypothetical protein GCM10023094_07330 [Rhodococcus olei]|uniref:RDD family protein n=1 Tax=Rhodococcus olei TaxID=2161675 RepID=A0ABP8NX30_9NOCA